MRDAPGLAGMGMLSGPPSHTDGRSVISASSRARSHVGGHEVLGNPAVPFAAELDKSSTRCNFYEITLFRWQRN